MDDVLDETNCGTLSITNTATLDADFLATPLPTDTQNDSMTAKHVAMQKGAAPGGVIPGDTVTYTLAFQVTDFATVTALSVADGLPDGIDHTPGSFTLNAPGYSGPITPVITDDSPVPGATSFTFDIHALTGDIAPGSALALTYTGTVQQQYDDGSGLPHNDGAFILARDSLGPVAATATYSLLQGATGCTDGSSAGVTVIETSILKEVVNVQPEYLPGESVIFRLTKQIPSGDTSAVVFEDFFPLPVFDVNSLNLTFGTDIVLGPSDTLGLTPTSITVDAGENSLRIEWPDITTTSAQTLQVDITIVVEDDPFADGLFLTNLFQAFNANTPGNVQTDLTPVQLTVRAPDLVFTKGVSATSGDGIVTPVPGSPVDSDLVAADAGDTVTFVLTAENQGGAPAYDVTFTDPAVAGLVSCSVASATIGGAATGTSGDLFGAGLVLADPIPAGDTALVTFTCTLDTTVEPRQSLTNTGNVNWASLSGAVTFPTLTDTADVSIASPTIAKTVSSIAPAGASPRVTGGDEVTWNLAVTLPEGTTPGLVLSDLLPAGFQFLSASVDTTGFGGTVDTSPGVASSGTVDGGQTVTLSFAGNTTVTDDGNPANNSFVVTVTARAVGSSSANPTGPLTKTNTVRLDWTGNPAGFLQDTVDVTYGEPVLDLTKTMTPDTNLDAGDTVTVQLELTNIGQAPAYDIVVTDILNALGENLFDLVAGATGTTVPAGYSFNYTNPNAVFSADPGTALAPGATVTFAFTATVRADVLAGSTFDNSATAAGDSQDGSVTDESPTSDSSSDQVSTRAVTVDKAITGSSESFTGNNPVAIGEAVTYRLTVTVPEGQTLASAGTPIVVDTLPNDFVYVPNSALIRAVADTTITGANLPGGLTPIPTVDTAITPTLNGRDVEFDLGTLTNNDNDGNGEELVITFQALVRNTSANQRNNNKNNVVTVTYLNDDGGTVNDTDNASLRLGEPNPTLTKTALPATVQGGDTVTFTVVFTNTNATRVIRGWEPVITDTLPARYLTPAVTSAAIGGGRTIDITACATFAGNTLTVDPSTGCLAAGDNYLDPVENITVIYTAVVDPAINFEETVDNTATGTLTSLPGTNGSGPPSAPGVPGAADGERTGSGVGANDLSGSDTATVTANQPTVTKTGDASLQINDTTTMTVEISVPVGTTSSFVLTDNLPTGLRYTGTAISIVSSSANLTWTGSPSTTPGAGTDPLVFDFANVSNASTVAETITITYEVEVENILGNQNTDTLTNTATLTYSGAATPSDSATVTVVEPNLNLVKTITAGASGSDAGDTISYQLVVQNTSGTGTAFRVSLDDILPPGLLGGAPTFDNVTLANPGGAVVLNADGVTPLAVGDAAITTTTNTDDTLAWPLVDMPPGSSVTITYDAVVVDTAPAGSIHVNTASADYNSQSDGSGRDGSTPGSDDDNDADLDNYNESDTATLTLDATLAIQKTIPSGVTLYTIGDTVTYRLRIDLVEGVTDNVVVTDTLPTGLEFTTGTTVVAPQGGVTTGWGGTPGVAGQIVTFDLGTVTIVPDGSNANDFVEITFDALVQDISGNTAGTTRTNSASVTSDAGNAGPSTVDIEIIEPNLVITKVPSDPNPSLGDPLTFTITVTNTGSNGADAYDVLLTDAIPAGLTYVTGSFSGDGSVDETDPANPEFDLGTIVDSSFKSFSFQVTVDDDAVVGAAIDNDIDAIWDSQAGDPAVERDYSDDATGTVVPGTPTFIDAVKTVAIETDGANPGVADPGDTLRYTITLVNTNGAASNVVFTDTVPANTTYVPASLTSSLGTPDDSGDPDLVVDIGALAASGTVTITFDVTVDGGTPAGTVLSNQGFVDSDQTTPEPTDEDGNDANGDQPTDIVVGGNPSAEDALYVGKLVSWTTDTVTAGVVDPNDVMTYSLFISNRGDGILTTVSVTDTVPTGLTLIPASDTCSAGDCAVTLTPPNVAVAITDLAVGETVVATFDVTIDAPLVDLNGPPTQETFTNQGTADSDQTDPIPTDGNLSPSDGYQPTSFTATDGSAGAPLMDHEKRWFLGNDVDGDGLVDPGDTIRYVIELRNDGPVAATNVRLTDPTPADTRVVAGSVATSLGVVLTEDPVSINIGTVDPGGLVFIQFEVTVDGGTPDGTIIPNQATATGDNIPPTPSDDNGDDSDGINPTLTPVDTDGSGGTPSGLLKSLVSTSEAGSTDPAVLIGEVLTYAVTFEVPAGTTREVAILDTLPTGLSYIPGTATLSRTYDTGLTTAQNPGGVNSAASGVPVSLTDGSDLDISGQVLTLFLGDVINSDDDVGAESYTLRFDAVVANIGGNDAGNTLTNTAVLEFQNGLGQDVSLTPTTIDSTVFEPNLDITKVAAPTLMLTIGGSVQYTVTVTNPAGGFAGPAYDVQITDTLPAEWTGLSVDSITPTGGVSGVIDNSAGTTLDITVDTFPADGQLVVVYTASAPGPLAEGTITNTATATWTSLPGSNGTGSATPGSAGDADGERTDSGAGANDHLDSDTSDVEVGDLNVTKTILNPQTRWAIGDIVEYQVVIGVPANQVVTSTIFTDVLAEGLTYETGTLAVNADGDLTLGATPAEFTRTDDSPAPGQETLELNWISITNTTGGVQSITLTYDALVDNVLSNQDNQTLPNVATLGFINPAGGAAATLTDGESVTVGEPDLTLIKSIPSMPMAPQAGDTVGFQIVVGNTGTTTAFEVVLTDILPTGLENVTNLQVTSTTGGAETPTFTNNGSDWFSSSFDVPVGSTVTITFDAELALSVIPGQQIQNTVQATFTSRDGTDANERDGSTTGSDQDDDSDLNNYNESDGSPTITVDDPVQLDKAFTPDPVNDTYTIGETVNYRLTLTLIEGTVDDVVVTDTLPAGLRYESSSVGLGNLGMTTGYGGTPVQAGQVLTFNLGQVVNPANGTAGDDVVTIDITATVLDMVPNVDGAVLGNNASLSFTGPSGTVTRDFDDDLGTPGIQPLDLTIVEPELTITKTADPTTLPQGDTVTFTLVIDHTAGSTADAFDLEVVDTLPAGLTYVGGSASLPPTSVVGQVLTWNIASLTLIDDSTSITFDATVDATVATGSVLTNGANLSSTSWPGANPDERSYTDADTSDVGVGETTFIDAVKTVGLAIDADASTDVTPGDTLEYQVTLTNSGADATSVVFTDPIPVGTTYVAATLTSSAGTTDDSDPTNLVVSVGPMLDGATVTITFRVTVDAGVTEGFIISNQGSVDSDQTLPEPTDVDGVDQNGDQPTDIPVGGAPSLDNPLRFTKTVFWLVDADLSGDVTPGDTMSYSFVIQNLGDTDLTAVSLTDTVPNGLTPVGGTETISGAGNTISVVGQALSASIPTLPAGSVVTAGVAVTIDGPPLFDTDADPNRETFVNQAAADSAETDPVPSDGNNDPTDGAQPTSFTAVDGVAGEPALDVEKRWFLSIDNDGDGLVDPGDTLEYIIRVINTGAADALNLNLGDTIPPDTTLVPGSVAISQGIVVTEDPVLVNIGNVTPGSTVLVVFLVTVDAGTPDGTIIPNQATVVGDNVPPTPSDDNGLDDDGLNPTLTPVDTDGSGGTPAGLDKSLTATSEAGSADPTVLVGEVLTYRVSAELPPGTTGEVRLVDTLPTGLTYIPGTARLSRTFDTGITAATDPGGVNTAASGTFVALADGTELDISGQVLSLFLGSVINSDNDADAESFTLEIQCVVANTAGNQAGTDLVNAFTLEYLDPLGQIQTLTGVTDTVTVAEPTVTATKGAAPAALLTAGGDVVFTVVVANPGGPNGAAAHDVAINDTLPAAFTGLTVDSITPTGGAAGITDNSAGTTMDITVDTLPEGASVTIFYTGTAPGPLATGTLTNTANVTWTSLPGTNGTGSATPGAAGTATGERTGDGAVNDHVTADSADVEVGQANLVKSVLNPLSRYAVGDVVDYQVVITVPALAQLANADFADILDEGLTYVPASLDIVYGAGLTSSLAPTDFTRTDDTPVAGQETLELAFGTLANATSGALTATLTYQATVDNILAVQNNTPLDNAVTLDFDPPGGGSALQLSDGETVTVGEPFLTLNKAITSPTAGLDAGDTVSFEITVGNTGTTTAFEVVLTDVLPTGLENATNLQVTSVTGGAETPTFTNNGSDWKTSGFDLPVGATVTITFDATLATDVIPGQQIQNSVDATFTSQDGATSGERDGSTPSSDQGDDTDLDNYNESDTSPTITVDDPVSLDKAFHPDATTDEYTIGDEVGYRLTISLIEGTVDDVVVTDTLPDGLRFESALVGLGNLGITTGYTPPPGQAGQVLTFDLGQVVNPADGDDTNDLITIDITATVENLAANQDGTVLGNNATLEFTGPSGTVSRPFDADLGTPGIQPLDLTVVEPDLELLKAVTDGTIQPGQEAEFTLTLRHTVGSNADAYDIVIVDTLPAELTYVPASSSPITPVVAGQTLTWTVASLTLVDAPVVITYRATLSPSAAVGVPVQNLANATFTTQPGADPDERTGADGSGGLNDLVTGDVFDVVVPTTPVLGATKVDALLIDADTNGVVNPGDTLRYTAVLTNSGNADATSVVFSDTPDANTTLVVGSATTTQGTVTVGNTVGDVTVGVDVGTVMPTATVTITFDVVVNSPLPTGVTAVANLGAFASGELPDEPTDDPDLPGDDDPTVTPVEAVPDLVITKDDGVATAAPGDTLTYTLTISNVGNQDATGVAVTDTLPVGTSFSAASDGGSETVPGSGVVTWPTFGLAAGDAVTRTVTVTVDQPAASGLASLVNTATVTDDGLNGDDPTPGDNTDTDTDTLDAAPDLTLTKDDGGATAGTGDTIAWTLSYANNGTQDATGVVLTETVPLHTTFNTGTSTAGWVCVPDGSAGSTCTLAIGALAAGANSSAVFAADVDANLPDGIDLTTNSASIADDGGNGDDPTPDDNSDSDDTPLVAVPDLVITKDDGGVTVVPGQTYAWTLAYDNVGDQDATGVVLTETVPDDTTFDAASSTPGWVCTPDASAGSTCTLAVGMVAPGAGGTADFAVTVDDPIQLGVDTLTNAVSIADDGSNGDDPTPDDNSDTDDTPVTVSPALEATKADGLFDDGDGDGQLDGGDTLRYTVELTATGDVAVPGVIFEDTPGAHLTLVAGSVTTTQGTVVSGNTAGDTTVRVDVGTLAVGPAVTVTFDAVVDDPLDPSVTSVSNQGLVYGDTVTGEPTDDPDTPAGDDPTDTPVGQQPVVDAIKGDALFDDADSSGSPSAGDVLEYTVEVANSGTADATGVVFTDTPDANTTLVAGSVTTTQGAVTVGNTGGDTVVEVDLGTLTAGTTATVTFRVTIDDPLPIGTSQVANQGLVTSDDDPDGEPTDDPDTPADDDPTDTPVSDLSELEATKLDTLVVDADANSVASPGDTLRYVTVIENVGAGAATGVVFTDTPDPLTALVAGSVVTSQGTVTSGNTAGDTGVAVDIGVVDPGATVTVRFDAVIANPLPAGTTRVANQGLVASDGDPDGEPTDDPDTPTDDDPTQTDLEAEPDLVVAKDDGLTVVTPPTSLTYTITVDNVGTIGATGIVLTDTLPGGTLFASASDGGFETAPGVVEWPTFDLEVGEFVTRTVTITVPDQAAGVPGVLTNTATAVDDGSNGDDPTPDDNTDTDTDTLDLSSAVEVAKSVSDPATNWGYQPNDIVTWTVAITNIGNQEAVNLQFVDPIPTNTSYVAGTIALDATMLTDALDADAGAFDGGAEEVLVTVDSLPAGATRTVTFSTALEPLASTTWTVVNQATVTGTDGDEPSDDPTTTDDDDPTSITVGRNAIPALDPIGMAVMVVLIALAAAFALRRR